MEKLIDMNRLRVGEDICPALRLLVGETSYSEVGDRLGITRQAAREMLRKDDKNLKFKTVNKFCKIFGYHVELVKDEQ